MLGSDQSVWLGVQASGNKWKSSLPVEVSHIGALPVLEFETLRLGLSPGTTLKCVTVVGPFLLKWRIIPESFPGKSR